MLKYYIKFLTLLMMYVSLFGMLIATFTCCLALIRAIVSGKLETELFLISLVPSVISFCSSYLIEKLTEVHKIL